MIKNGLICLLTACVLATAVPGIGVAAETKPARPPLQVSQLADLLTWIAASSIDRVSAEGLLSDVELATLTALERKRASLTAMPKHVDNTQRDVAAFERWLAAVEPDPSARGLLVRGALARTLAGLHEDGTRLHLPHKYMLPPEVEGYDKGGLGILVAHEPDAQGRFIIFETLDGFPGSEVGLRSGDRLVGVADRSVVGLSYRELADLVRGNLGTHVKIQVERPGQARALTFEVERVWLNPNPKNISAREMDGNIGYVRVKYLGERMDLELARVLDKFKQDGVKKVILDLRNNEGLLQGTEDVGAVFLGPNQEITHIVDRAGDTVRHTHGKQLCDLPLVVLVNRYTDGSGILLAGALRDHHRARLVGEATRWRDQPCVSRELNDGSTVTVTTGYYVLPAGETLRARNRSLVPEVVVAQDPLYPFGGPNDDQLQRAVALSK